MGSVESVIAALADREPPASWCVEWSPARWRALWAHLTPPQQRVVYLHVFLGLTHTQIAERLGIARGSVDGAWRRALDRIRDALPGEP